ncbi:DNA-binding CsgD family transcriptional regulator/tetratricopeptide (TPR) repeat protein [Streptomyces olivoverticillatus]|uniref:DNA-binding CsgD family transcriptional regulator/tetratricopeptide (TPR) repeat protein n=1 Tax=Streptomyces olivoverticillatus TaxID=66427 RepID=A0A7W7LP09_9ACTN|nr:DNA-binding CsgD family transcriptional regulator/tetratricopeptide (TPR) repeat protein [Streptomyces olivoverticillatus]
MARHAERREFDRLVTSAAVGRGGAVVVAGEAGIGKSTLIDAAVGTLDGFEVLRAAGTEFERDLLYATLHQLCAPVLEHRRALPAVQRRALEGVFGLGAQTSPDPLTVGLAVLGLLHEVAQHKPVCCVVDDAQWIDDASRRALVFVARRVAAERIAVVFAARDVGSVPGLADLPRLPLAGLGDEDARAVLGAATHAELDTEVVDRILAEARGNPLALLEFAHHAEPFGVPGPQRCRATVVDTLEEQFVHRFERLPDTTRSLVVLAAAEPVGDLGLLRRAAKVIGLDATGLTLAENAGLLALGPRLRFRHPLVRSAVYASATPGMRRRVHGALAEATDPEADRDRRAWHRAHAVVDADENVAAELEGSADRARLRGGFAAAATFMERAGQLTPASDRQAGRLLAAAQLRLQAGAPTLARTLVARAERRPMDEKGRAAARLLRARVDYQLSHSPQATARLVDVVAELAPDQARETYLEAFASFMYNDNQPGRLQELGARIRNRKAQQESARPADLLLDALLAQTMLPVERAVPAMRDAATAYHAAAPSSGHWRMNLLCQVVIDLRDDVAMEEISDRQVDVARRQGALASLPQALRYQAISRVSVGRFDDAAASLGEAQAVDEAAGTTPLLGPELVLAGFRGDLDRYRELRELLGRGGRPYEAAGEHYARAVLHNGLGNYEAALEAALAAQHRHQAGSYSIWAVYTELVEAAARAGRGEEAVVAMKHLEALARTNPLPWAVAEWLQAQALLSRGEDCEALHRQAIDHFARTRVRVLHARARLTYGEWLRRANRRVAARDELRAAHDMLSGIGARAFAERAARELRATGEQPSPHGEHPLGRLTPQERLIAGKVAAGATSKEVGVMLFLSPRTIDAHLRNVYRKLGISSRRQLRGMSL